MFLARAVARVGGALPGLRAMAPAAPCFASPLAIQVRHRISSVNYASGQHRKHKAGRPHAGKGNAVWWQPLLPALAAERCPDVGSSKRTNDKKRKQQRAQQAMWDRAKWTEMQRRRAIFNTLKRDAAIDETRRTYAEFADFLREHPNGFTPSPSPRQQKLAARACAAETATPAPELPQPGAPSQES
jgi:hypothetical protein